jgi:GNAT superfamily N-acetyltransferase
VRQQQAPEAKAAIARAAIKLIRQDQQGLRPLQLLPV